MSVDQKKLQFIFNLRNAGVTDKNLLTAMEKMSRSHFVQNSFKKFALEDTALPIDCGQITTKPSIIGAMVQALQVTDRCKILEIGTGSGYQTSILAMLGRRVYSVERYQKLAISAQNAIGELSISNVVIICADGASGLRDQEPFDRIILSAALEDVSKFLLDQLKPNGILVAPVGKSEPMQTLIRVRKQNMTYDYTDLKSVKFTPMIEGRELVVNNRAI